MNDAELNEHIELKRSRSHQSNCKWIPGWWDPICRVCDELQEIEADKKAQNAENTDLRPL